MTDAISINNFVSGVIVAVDLAIENFVQTSFKQLVSNNTETITAILILYVMLVSIRGMYRGLSMEDLVFPIIRMVFIYITATKWNYFQLFFYDIFTKAPDDIISIISNGVSIKNGLNAAFSQGFTVANEIFNKAGWNSMASYFWAIVVHIVNFGAMVAALGLIVLAKFTCALYLFLGPIFIMFALFDTTKQLFEKWLQQLITTALIPVLTCGVLLLSLSISKTVLGNLIHSVQIDQGILTRIGEFVAFQMLSLYLLSQVKAVAAALTGGVALAGLNSAMQAGRAFRENNLARAQAVGVAFKMAAGGKKAATSGASNYANNTVNRRGMAAQNLANRSRS